ncbi:hypothetical protein THAOC_18958 [Thalassiosira oceanica]|uniref:Uncharacterized protein n=1 Tax=Thalassiosira oceanica TaxID=159749 RepID=K0S3M3_THAOC|nr:hypothetical protein THAOC_18958 [Thalassiosira oceanica]|eukprot:EJK60648.1 hypothetical protein THAOC_18958 [Thalassiosira oceanica]
MEEYRRKIECMKRKRGNVPDGDEPWGGRRGGGGREGPSPDGHRATLQAYREEYWPTTEEETEHSPRRPGLKTAGEGPAGNAARSCRGNDGGLSDPDMLDGEEGSSDSSSDDDGLDLYPAGARRPVKRLRAEDNDDSEVDEPRPAGARRPVKRLRAEDGDDSDIDEPHPAGAKRPVQVAKGGGQR